jgi:2-hydroxycyclohexanecarboxyl-CoA dehydrogenase
MSLAGKNAVVTGGASGIGRAICLRLARDGANIAVLDLDLAGGQRVAREVAGLGRQAVALEVDVGSLERVRRAAEAVHSSLGRVQVLVNDAGIADFTPLIQMTEEQWDRMIRVHLKGTFNCARTFLQDMFDAGWGRVINLSSVAGLAGAAGLVHYAAAKAGIVGFTKSLAREVAGLGITVNAIAPGLIDTPLVRKSGVSEEMIAQVVQQTPVGRIGVPEDIAAACAFLASEEASFFTGQVMSPNGGQHL